MSNNYYNGDFANPAPTIELENIQLIINDDFLIEDFSFKNIELMYYVKNNFAYLVYHIDAITYSEAYKYLIDAHSGEIIKKWSLIHDDGPILGSGENLLGEWVDEINIYEGITFNQMENLITPYLVCENYCFDYGDCGGSSNSGCEIDPQQGNCQDNYLEDCNGDCFHEWYLQFPGVGNGFL